MVSGPNLSVISRVSRLSLCVSYKLSSSPVPKVIPRFHDTLSLSLQSRDPLVFGERERYKKVVERDTDSIGS